MDLKKWVLDNWQGLGRVEETKDDSEERKFFMALARKAFGDRGIPVKRLRTWFNVQLPDHAEGLYDKGYPHVHQDESAVTLVYYIDPGDVPAPLDILEGDRVVETIYPESGKIVFIKNGVLHGVRKNRGTTPRVALIATAYP